MFVSETIVLYSLSYQKTERVRACVRARSAFLGAIPSVRRHEDFLRGAPFFEKN